MLNRMSEKEIELANDNIYKFARCIGATVEKELNSIDDLCEVTIKMPFDYLSRFGINIPSQERMSEKRIKSSFEVKDVRVYGDRVVVMYFTDGTYTKACCTKNDAEDGKFDIDMGILICLARKMLGDDGNNRKLKKTIRYIRKLMNDNEKDRRKIEAENKKKEQDRIIKNLKAAEEIANERNKDIDDIKKAIIEALKYVNASSKDPIHVNPEDNHS